MEWYDPDQQDANNGWNPFILYRYCAMMIGRVSDLRVSTPHEPAYR
ncbi:hypothetical protein GIJ05_05650 [Laceyella tengchongensis]|nr:hypothetical protein [Laceyella tengchongensis]